MADFIMFDEGANELLDNGLPSTCYFLLSTKDCNTHVVGDTLAGAGNLGELTTGTGYTRKSQAEPAASGRAKAFSLMSWTTGAATDWPASVKSVVLVTTADNTGKGICAWNLQTGGAARDLSGANTTENVTPTLSLP